MADKDEPAKPVAPGYPAAEALEDLDVSGWEPAAVFRPVESAGPVDESDSR